MPRRITVFAKFEGKCLCEKPAVVCLAGQDMPDGPRVCQGISRNSAQDFTWSAQTWVSCHNYIELSIDLGQVQKWMDWTATLVSRLLVPSTNIDAHYMQWYEYFRPQKMGQNKMCYWFYADISVVKRSKHNAHNVVCELLECCDKERERYREATKEVCRLLQDSSDPLLLFFQIDLVAGNQRLWVFKC